MKTFIEKVEDHFLRNALRVGLTKEQAVAFLITSYNETYEVIEVSDKEFIVITKREK